MTLTIEISNSSEIEKLLAFLKTIHWDDFKIISTEKASESVIAKGDKSLDPTALFGIWKDNPRTLEQIRAQAWERNWNVNRNKSFINNHQSQ